MQDGSATVIAEFRLEKPTQEALDDVRDAISRVRGRFQLDGFEGGDDAVQSLRTSAGETPSAS